MKLTLPLLVQETQRAGSAVPELSVRPLFFPAPIGRGDHLSRATANLAQGLRKHLDSLGKQSRHDALIPWTFNPDLQETQLKQKLILRRGTLDCCVLVVWFAAFNRRLAMMPAVQGRWFEVSRGQHVLERAAEVLTQHLNQLQKQNEALVPGDLFTAKNKQWVSSLDLDIEPEPEFKKPSEALLAMLGGAGKMSGRVELQKVGRCLDWLYPDELNRAILRDAEVTELERLLSASDRRPVLLLGPSQVGKTTVLHDCVFRRVQKSKTPHVANQNVWLLSPPRLISGMMYLGQWESRLTAIIQEAARHDHVLYFDDVLGMYSAGRSRDSDLTVADVLKPRVERREFRMLAEMTPEAFRVLQEKDRGLADQFHVLPIRPTSEDQTRSILFEVRRQLEGRHRCRFNLDVLRVVLDLSNRYLREASQPGKSAQLFGQLAIKHAGQDVQREQVLGDFRDRSGLSLDFLDDRARLGREQIIESIRRSISGQDEAVEAVADAVSIAKARLNDPGRPLASFLFLGPTGVGKTECAKALCEYLFGDVKRLLRFDMNEYLDPSSPSRLIGTFSNPEGLLTAAIRRQPFSVILLDEIEKAHPAVFDLLLQLLGEGRLTDSLGRTADFGNAIIIMTSNLGARSAGSSFGLRAAEPSARKSYIDAAERFFRPEFFNRIDRLVPFHQLTRAQVARIAERLMREVLQRDGLIHRQCVVSVDPVAMELVIDQGFHPELGARALKRSLERQLTQPIAACLTRAVSDAPAVISLLPGPDGIRVEATALTYADRNAAGPLTDLSNASEILDRIDAVIDRVDDAVAGIELTGGLTQGFLSPAHFRYLAVRELMEEIRQTAERLDRLISAPKRRGATARPKVQAPRVAKKMMAMSTGDVRICLRAAADLESHLAAMELDPPPFGESLADQLIELIRDTALMDTIAASSDADAKCLLWLRSPNYDAATELNAMVSAYVSVFGQNLGLTVSELHAAEQPMQSRQRAVVLEMPGIARVMAHEHGTHLFTGWARGTVVIQAIVVPAGDRDPLHLLKSLQSADRNWRSAASHGQAGEDPFPLLHVLRVYDGAAMTVDLRSGLAAKGLPSPVEMRKFLVSQLATPAEFGRQFDGEFNGEFNGGV